MAPGADPAFQQAMDKLMLQVNRDNILAAHRAFRDHADRLQDYLQKVVRDTSMRLCGGDPVSAAAIGPQSFGGKITELLRVHWEHWQELDAVATHLHDTARSYGHTEEAITQSLGAGQNK